MQTNQQEVINALPYMLAYPAFLAGYQTIPEAMNDQLLSNYLSAFIEEDELDLVALWQPNNADEADRAWFDQVSNNPSTIPWPACAPTVPQSYQPIFCQRSSNGWLRTAIFSEWRY